ncbi:MAG: RNA polymerase sigma factor [Solirubrobacterales bacterium]
MSDFRPLTERELLALTPEQLIAYHHEARRLGQHNGARAALGILVFGFIGQVRFWVSRRLPPQDVDDVAGEVIESAIKSSFDGAQPRQFGAWLRRIARRRVADYFDAQSRRPKEGPLPDEHEGEEDIWGTAGEVPDATEEIANRSLIDQALDELNPVHRRVVELAGPQDLGFEQRPGKQTAQMINDQFSDRTGDPMTEANVHQILSRFRRRLAKLLDGDDGGSADG